MAILLNLHSLQRLTLLPSHTFGRDSVANLTYLGCLSCSRLHALISWNGEAWVMKDISTNGCYLGQQRIPKGQLCDLQVGDIIRFGHDMKSLWKVENLQPPITCLWPLGREYPVILLYDVEVLSIEENEIMIYLNDAHRWVCEQDGTQMLLKNGDKVGALGRYWQFVEARPCTTTRIIDQECPHQDIGFRFQVSQDEEHVNLTLVFEQGVCNLGERNHHYLLLLLARQRLMDAQAKMRSQEQAWLKKEQLSRMLGISEQHINVQVHRFRKYVSLQLPESVQMQQIIERRTGEIRFAYSNILIEGGVELASSRSYGC